MIPFPLEGTHILKEEQPRDMIHPSEIKDPNWMLKEKLKCEDIGTSEENSVADKYVPQSMCHELFFIKIPMIWFSEQIWNLK